MSPAATALSVYQLHMMRLDAQKLRLGTCIGHLQSALGEEVSDALYRMTYINVPGHLCLARLT
jgi:hypothetical protein